MFYPQFRLFNIENAAMIGKIVWVSTDHSITLWRHIYTAKNMATLRQLVIVIVAISYIRAHHKEPHICNITGRRLTIVAPKNRLNSVVLTLTLSLTLHRFSKKTWSHIWLLENKNEFISGKIMKRHHHHHHYYNHLILTAPRIQQILYYCLSVARNWLQNHSANTKSKCNNTHSITTAKQ